MREAEVIGKKIIGQSNRRKKERIKGNVQSIRLTNVLLGMALPIVLLVSWETAGALGLLNPLLLPTPSDILREFAALTYSGELIRHLGISAWRALLGFLLGASLGLAVGIWVGLSYRTER